MTTAYFQSHYIPNTEQEQAEMLATLGLDSIDQLFQDIPQEFRNPPLDLPAPMSELEIQQELGALACLLYTSPSPRDGLLSRMPSSA